MIDYNDPELVLIKKFRGNKKSFFQITSFDKIKVTLKDIEHGAHFAFNRNQLEQHIKNGLLTTSNIQEMPDTIAIKPVFNYKKSLKKKEISKNSREKLERKFKYAKAALHSEEVPAYTAKWLEPFIAKMAIELNDDKPPTWRTLAQWISNYVKSGWKKESLKPQYDKRQGRKLINSEAEKIMKNVIHEFSKTKINVNFTAAHREYISRIEKVNAKNEKENKPLIKPASLRTFINRFNSYK